MQKYDILQTYMLYLKRVSLIFSVIIQLNNHLYQAHNIKDCLKELNMLKIRIKENIFSEILLKWEV